MSDSQFYAALCPEAYCCSVAVRVLFRGRCSQSGSADGSMSATAMGSVCANPPTPALSRRRLLELAPCGAYRVHPWRRRCRFEAVLLSSQGPIGAGPVKAQRFRADDVKTPLRSECDNRRQNVGSGGNYRQVRQKWSLAKRLWIERPWHDCRGRAAAACAVGWRV